MTLALLLSIPTASAFCGTYVGGVDDSITNRESHVVIAYDGVSTHLTLAMDFEGDADAFALLLPMPTILQSTDVSTPDQELVDAVEAYGSPRAVEYTCDDALPYSMSCGPFGCASSGADSGGFRSYDVYGDTASTGTVQVVNAFDVGGYSLVVLSAEESTGLWTWLDDNGYAVPAGGEEILQSYIDAGQYFVAIKIDVAELGVTGWLPPLQFRYEGSNYSLPIRIGTISADGEQEVLINAFAPSDRGQLAIANYPEYGHETDCMADWGSDFSAWYTDRLDQTFGAEAGWIREHSWPVYHRTVTMSTSYHCDPCSPEVSVTGDFTSEQLGQLGARGDDIQFTRLRIRYQPEQAVEDLSFYFDGITETHAQSRFILYKNELESLYPMCDSGWPENPGTCPVSETPSLALVLGPLGLFVGGAWATRRRR